MWEVRVRSYDIGPPLSPDLVEGLAQMSHSAYLSSICRVFKFNKFVSFFYLPSLPI